MRELAPFEQFDTKNGFYNVGNPGLKRTLINNFDIRYELYTRPGEIIAVSAYYKTFKDQIIRAFNPKATIPELSFVNVDKAEVLGAEFEFRKSLDFITPFMHDFYFNTNLTVIQSSVDIPTKEIENSKNIDSTLINYINSILLFLFHLIQSPNISPLILGAAPLFLLEFYHLVHFHFCWCEGSAPSIPS
jgi:outer membrane receptor protein involved in Fe transport